MQSIEQGKAEMKRETEKLGEKVGRIIDSIRTTLS